eukprot:scaffold284988_cov32-Prasinocladus_malaysianus.AAC.1
MSTENELTKTRIQDGDMQEVVQTTDVKPPYYAAGHMKTTNWRRILHSNLRRLRILYEQWVPDCGCGIVRYQVTVRERFPDECLANAVVRGTTARADGLTAGRK